MYADDTVLYVHGLTKTEVAVKLTNAMVKITAWLNQCCLQLNVSKTVCMFFSKTNDSSENPDVLVSGEKLEIVKEFKYHKHKNACLFYKIIHGLSTPPLREFVNIRTNPCRITRGVTRGDCIIPSRKSAFSQSAFSVTASREWNNIPTCIRDLNTYRSFSSNLKQWFIDNMTCQH